MDAFIDISTNMMQHPNPAVSFNQSDLMIKKLLPVYSRLCIAGAIVAVAPLAWGEVATGYPDPSRRFVSDIQQILEKEQSDKPPHGAIVCVGSSSMRGWEPDLDRDLYPLTLVKRGFGGSNFADALYYIDDLVLKHKPRAVLVYEGDNDIGGVGVSPATAFRTASAFVDRIHEQLPDCRIYFISAKPSPIRWDKWPVMQELNGLLKQMCAVDARLFFIDIGPVMMDKTGVPDKSIFKQDLLHMNRAGYELWRSVIRPVLIANELSCENRETIRLVRKWEVSKGVSTPESVYYHAAGNMLYVSNIGEGAPADRDGDGYISKLSPDGKMVTPRWAVGLNAPKGITVQDAFLYVTDVDQLVKIDLASGKIVHRYAAGGAHFLNDVASDERGNVFVGDSSEENSKIYRLEKGSLNTWVDSPEILRPNGLSIEEGDLLVGNVGNNKLNRINVLTREITLIADSGSRIDGLEPLGQGRYLVSNWLGRIACIDTDGSVITLQDTEHEKINAADFEFLPEQNLLVVPTFFDNRITAYSLE